MPCGGRRAPGIASRMKIFISYASEQRPIAEKIAFALRGRGHLAFFDKEDLPPGSSYDEQIVRAIAASDLLVFLISPEAVTAGRYTLTELMFARKKWKAPKGRVLPVMVSPTAPASIPVYLANVEFLTPEGNVAAEVAAVVDDIIPTAKPQGILPAAILLGMLSGLLSSADPLPTFAMMGRSLFGPEGLSESADRVLFFFEPLRLPAAYAFSAVVAVLLVVWDRMPWSKAALSFPLIAVGWTGAYFLAFFFVLQLDQSNLAGPAAPPAKQCAASSAEDSDTAAGKSPGRIPRRARKSTRTGRSSSRCSAA
jgi:TIR domain-containing protein